MTQALYDKIDILFERIHELEQQNICLHNIVNRAREARDYQICEEVTERFDKRLTKLEKAFCHFRALRGLMKQWDKLK